MLYEIEIVAEVDTWPSPMAVVSLSTQTIRFLLTMEISPWHICLFLLGERVIKLFAS